MVLWVRASRQRRRAPARRASGDVDALARTRHHAGAHGLDNVFNRGRIGLAMIILENFSKGKAYALPAMAIGMGIYLPPDVSVTIAFGSVTAFLCGRWRSKRNHGTDAQGQTLIACGFIVGESLTGIILAIANVSAPSILQHMPMPDPWVRQWLGLTAFLAAAFWMASLKSGADKMPYPSRASEVKHASSSNFSVFPPPHWLLRIIGDLSRFRPTRADGFRRLHHLRAF